MMATTQGLKIKKMHEDRISKLRPVGQRFESLPAQRGVPWRDR